MKTLTQKYDESISVETWVKGFPRTRKTKTVGFLFLKCPVTISWLLAEPSVERQQLSSDNCKRQHVARNPHKLKTYELKPTLLVSQIPVIWIVAFMSQLENIHTLLSPKISITTLLNNIMETFVWDECRDLSQHPPYPLTLPSNPHDEILCNWCLAEWAWLPSSRVSSKSCNQIYLFFYFLSNRNLPIVVVSQWVVE